MLVRKDETYEQAQTYHRADKILKICTFVVKPAFRGEKFGELFLKQALWFAQRNSYQLVYLTTHAEQRSLINVPEFYGFVQTMQRDGELVFEKTLTGDRLIASDDDDIFDLDRMNYPRFVGRDPVKAFCVPIQGAYHCKLFPELALPIPMPLFPGWTEPVSAAPGRHLPGNTIRKVYLCRAKTHAMRSGDLLVFYQSRSPGLASSQSITSVGIVESVAWTDNFEEITRITAKRSVFSELELKAMASARDGQVMIIDFLLAGHVNPTIPLSDLVRDGVFSRHPPQSICHLRPAAFETIRQRIDFGFAL